MDGVVDGLVPERGGLYSVGELLGGWVVDDEGSYAKTLDARVFRGAAAEGLRVPVSDDTARRRALHDHAVTRALNAQVKGRRVVAFMGGHQLARDSAAYALVAGVARELTRRDYLVVSGGGPGAMEAAHLGARLAPDPDGDLAAELAVLARHPAFPPYRQEDLLRPDGTFDADLLAALHAWQAPAFDVAGRRPGETAGVSLGVPTWLYGHEPPTPLATAHAKALLHFVTTADEAVAAITGGARARTPDLLGSAT